MSGVVHAVKSVFHGITHAVGHIVHEVAAHWEEIAIVVAAVYTGGLALGAWGGAAGAAGAAGGGAATFGAADVSGSALAAGGSGLAGASGLTVAGGAAAGGSALTAGGVGLAGASGLTAAGGAAAGGSALAAGGSGLAGASGLVAAGGTAAAGGAAAFGASGVSGSALAAGGSGLTGASGLAAVGGTGLGSGELAGGVIAPELAAPYTALAANVATAGPSAGSASFLNSVFSGAKTAASTVAGGVKDVATFMGGGNTTAGMALLAKTAFDAIGAYMTANPPPPRNFSGRGQNGGAGIGMHTVNNGFGLAAGGSTPAPVTVPKALVPGVGTAAAPGSNLSGAANLTLTNNSQAPANIGQSVANQAGVGGLVPQGAVNFNQPTLTGPNGINFNPQGGG